eukprot:355524-Chlamydomonas_euryale.AAC.49
MQLLHARCAPRRQNHVQVGPRADLGDCPRDETQRAVVSSCASTVERDLLLPSAAARSADAANAAVELRAEHFCRHRQLERVVQAGNEEVAHLQAVRQMGAHGRSSALQAARSKPA